MMISIALRFIPDLLDEAKRIMKAQASRGADFNEGSFMEKIKSIISLIIPLFISAFQRAEELANAMESRNYNPEATRTKYKVLTLITYLNASMLKLCILYVLLLDYNEFYVMNRIKCIVSFDGSKFHGFQVQNQFRTVQCEIQKAIKNI